MRQLLTFSSPMDSDLDDFEVIDLPPAPPAPTSSEKAAVDAKPKSPDSDKPLRPTTPLTDPEFRLLVSILQETVNAKIKGPIFHANLDLQNKSLFERYLLSLDEDLRAEHTCNSCHHFLNRFGDLCQVQDDGTLRPLIWPQAPDDRVPLIYRTFLSDITKIFDRKAVGREYRLTASERFSLGEEVTRGSRFQHFHVRLAANTPLARLHDLSTDTSYDMLARVLDDYDLKVITEAHHLLHHKLLHSTSHRPAIIWLKGTAETLNTFNGDEVQKRNLLTRYASAAPVGFLSALRGGLIGTLLTDIKSGLEFNDISKRWDNLANGLAYMRPTALPSAGNVKIAEKSFSDLGYSKDDLMRYFMTIDQIPDTAILWKDHALWNRLIESRGTDRIFASLDSVTSSSSATFKDDESPPTQVSFRTFVRKTLPNAESIELDVASTRVLSFFTVGAPNTKSPFYFGSEKNTASWYLWAEKRSVATVGLNAGYCKVSTITTFPHMWEYMTAQEAVVYEENQSAGDEEAKRRWAGAKEDVRFMFCLHGGQSDTGTAGIALFPSLMRGEFHGVRKTVEAFSQQHRIGQPLSSSGLEQVMGICNYRNTWESLLVRVTLKSGIRTKYCIALFE